MAWTSKNSVRRRVIVPCAFAALVLATVAAAPGPVARAAPDGRTAAGESQVAGVVASRKGSLRLRVAGQLLGSPAKVVVKGQKGPARGVKRRVRLMSESHRVVLTGLPPGRYVVKPRTISSSGWRAKAKRKKAWVKRGRTVTRTSRYVAVRTSQPSTSAAPRSRQRVVWHNGWQWADLNGDGRWDSAAQGGRTGGLAANWWVDTNADNYWDFHYWDTTGRGSMVLQLDPDYNGTLDAYLWDSDGDGRLDRAYSDYTGRRTVALNSSAAVNGVLSTQALVNLVGMHNHWEDMGYTSTGSILFPTIPHPALL